MVSLHDYIGREQSYVKHVFLESYLEALAYKTASAYPHRRPDVNKIAARLRSEKRLAFPDWEDRKRVPHPTYRTQRT